MVKYGVSNLKSFEICDVLQRGQQCWGILKCQDVQWIIEMTLSEQNGDKDDQHSNVITLWEKIQNSW